MTDAAHDAAEVSEADIGTPPLAFIGPASLPLHIEALGYKDNRGECWVRLRTETINGSHVAFLTLATANHLRANLLGAMEMARDAIIVPPTTATNGA